MGQLAAPVPKQMTMEMAYVSPSANNMQQANQFRGKKKKIEKNHFLMKLVPISKNQSEYSV